MNMEYVLYHIKYPSLLYLTYNCRSMHTVHKTINSNNSSEAMHKVGHLSWQDELKQKWNTHM